MVDELDDAPAAYDPAPELVPDAVDGEWSALVATLPNGSREVIADVHLVCGTQSGARFVGADGATVRLCRHCLHEQATGGGG